MLQYLLFAIALIFASGCKKSDGGGRSSSGTGLQVDAPVEDPPDVTNVAGNEAADEDPTTGLMLPSNINLRPDADSVSGTALRFSLNSEKSDFELANVEKFIWDPAQKPLKTMNQVLCVLTRTGFHTQVNKGEYIATVTLKECFREDVMTAAPANDSKAKPAEVRVIATQANANSPVIVKFWYSKNKYNTTEATTGAIGFGDLINFYGYASVEKYPTKKNPYGLFNLKWQFYGYDWDGDENDEAYTEGYLNISKDTNDKIKIDYREDQPLSNSSNTTCQGSDVSKAFRNMTTDVSILDSVSSDIPLKCTGNCFKPQITTHEVGISYTFYSATVIAPVYYVFRASDKKLYFDWNSDGAITNADLNIGNGGFAAYDSNGDTFIDNTDVGADANNDGFVNEADSDKNADSVIDLNDLVIGFVGSPNTEFTMDMTSLDGTIDYRFAMARPTYNITYRNLITKQASAVLSIGSSGPESGIARTSEKYWTESSPADVPCSWTSGLSDNSGSYALSFHLTDGTDGDNEYDGRTMTKYIPGSGNTTWAGQVAGGYNPTAPRCEQAGGETPYIWEWGLFNQAGDRVYHTTSFPVDIPKDGSWAGGWVSPWGTWIYGAADGDTAYITQNGVTKTYTVDLFNGSLLNQNTWRDVTITATGIIPLDCSSSCPKANMVQADFDNQWDSDNGNDTLYLAGAQEYFFDSSDHKLYLDPDGDGNYADKQEVKFSGVTSGSVYINLTDNSVAPSVPYSYSISSWSLSGFFYDSSTSSYFQPPEQMQFADRVYNDDTDAYPGAKNPSKNGQNISSFNYGSNWTFDSGWLCCISWEQKTGLVNEWGSQIWMPEITPNKGFQLTLSNDPDGTGPLASGQTFKLAPLRGEFRAVAKTDCKQSLVDALSGVESTVSLPAALSTSAQNVKSAIGAAPTTATAKILVVDGVEK